MNKELKQKAERFRKKYKQDIIDNDDFEMLDKFDVNVERAYIAGATEATEATEETKELQEENKELKIKISRLESYCDAYNYSQRTYQDEIKELKAQIEKMKSCPICKYRKKSTLDEPCKHCSRCAFSNNALDQENVSDKWELAEN